MSLTNLAALVAVLGFILVVLKIIYSTGKQFGMEEKERKQFVNEVQELNGAISVARDQLEKEHSALQRRFDRLIVKLERQGIQTNGD